VKSVADLVAGHQLALTRAAFLLTGDVATAQDLVQETVVRLLVHRRRFEQAQSPEAYARRALVNVFLTQRRRAWHGETPSGQLPETWALAPYEAVEDMHALRAALLALPPRQRAAVVLRHYDDRSEAETAELMGCSVGNVKALTSRGLASLRVALSPAIDLVDGTAR
jgi:RNA polymerase sigma-70 factor (sigma-E family)